MIKQTFEDLVTQELAHGAVLNYEFDGFVRDYLVLHCLLKMYKPATIFEIGTNFGTGTNIICNAVPEAVVYSLELPFGEGDKPLTAAGFDHTGENCKYPFIQLRGDSTNFDYSKYKSEAYFVDAGHFYDNVLAETIGVLSQEPLLVIYHDADIQGVYDGILAGMNDKYEAFRVIGTRIAYLLKI